MLVFSLFISFFLYLDDPFDCVWYWQYMDTWGVKILFYFFILKIMLHVPKDIYLWPSSCIYELKKTNELIHMKGFWSIIPSTPFLTYKHFDQEKKPQNIPNEITDSPQPPNMIIWSRRPSDHSTWLVACLVTAHKSTFFRHKQHSRLLDYSPIPCYLDSDTVCGTLSQMKPGISVSKIIEHHIWYQPSTEMVKALKRQKERGFVMVGSGRALSHQPHSPTIPSFSLQMLFYVVVGDLKIFWFLHTSHPNLSIYMEVFVICFDWGWFLRLLL